MKSAELLKIASTGCKYYQTRICETPTATNKTKSSRARAPPNEAHMTHLAVLIDGAHRLKYSDKGLLVCFVYLRREKK
eukprot:SAG31_NODE_3011_length_4788_cov_5.207080_2_plen_78_part_00